MQLLPYRLDAFFFAAPPQKLLLEPIMNDFLSPEDEAFPSLLALPPPPSRSWQAFCESHVRVALDLACHFRLYLAFHVQYGTFRRSCLFWPFCWAIPAVLQSLSSRILGSLSPTVLASLSPGVDLSLDSHRAGWALTVLGPSLAAENLSWPPSFLSLFLLYKVQYIF